MKKRKNTIKLKKLNINGIKKWLFKSKFNFFVILLSIIGIALGTYLFGFLFSIILFAILDIILLGIHWFLNKGTAVQVRKKKKFALILFLILCIIGLVGSIVFAIIIVREAPEFNPENLYTKESSVLYDKDGEVYAKLGAEQRIKITYDQIPQVLIDAIIATEDSRFYTHNGIDLPRFLKASATQLLGRGGGGASTITMQVAKNAYTSPVSNGWEGIKRKFTDIYLAVFKIEKAYTKEEILEFYVNSYYMGGGAYGVEQASRNYFGKSVSELNLSEAAMIAGLFKGGNAYDPYLYPDNTEARRKVVLSLMLRHGYIDEEEYNTAKELTVEDIVKKIDKSSSSKNYAYQSFIDTVVEEVKKRTKAETGTEQNPYEIPMEIYTTMDRSKQQYLDDLMNGENSSYKWENDVVEAGIVVTDTNTGAVVAVGAGRDKNAVGTYNYATMIKNQIGSTAKPLYDYGPAFEYNNWSPAQPLPDEEYSYSTGGELHNWDSKYKGYMDLREALKLSRNIPALKTFKAVKNEQIKEFVTNLGLSPEISGGIIHEAHSIGGYNGESPLTLAAAYGSFANGGTYIEPYTFTKITYKDSDKVFTVTPVTRKAMSDSTAYMVTNVLLDTAAYTTGTNRVNGISYANKTGTSNFSSQTKKAHNLPSNAVNDLWVAGYSRDYAVALWYGYDKIDRNYTNKMSSGQNTRLFKAVIKGVLSGTSSFTMPSSVVEVEIETQTSTPLLASEYTPNNLRKKEVFKAGTEPTDVSQRFSKLNNVTNLKATTNGSKVTLTWNEVKSDAIDETALRNDFSKIFTSTKYLNEFINARINYNNNYIGKISYNVYKKQSDGSLKLLGNTVSTSYEDVATDSSTTYVVKTTYTIFKNNASDGAETTVSTTGSESIISAQLNGDSTIILSVGTPFTDLNKPVIVLENSIDVTDKATITKTITGPSNTIDTSIEGTYIITYKISYNGFVDTLTKTIQVKNS